MKFKSQAGASVIEFAVILPLLVVLVFGIIEFGMLLYNQQVITNASREGARAGIVAQNPRLLDYGPDPPGSIDSIVQKYCLNHLVTFGVVNSPPSTTLFGYSANAPFGQDLTVKLTYNYEFLVIPNFIPVFNKLRTMTAQTVMRYE
jgi:hypothetical protein